MRFAAAREFGVPKFTTYALVLSFVVGFLLGAFVV
jgi:hypothetical protein